MKNLFQISDYFVPFAHKIKFATIVVGRFLKICFRRRKGIQLNNLEYSTKYIFDKSFATIHYSFRNALWYNFKGLKKTIGDTDVVINLANLQTLPLVFVVQGFFRKKVYNLSFTKEHQLMTAPFLTSVAGLNKQTAFISPQLLQVNVRKAEARLAKVAVNIQPVKINSSTFKQTDFI